jgi:hypothetical protein
MNRTQGIQRTTARKAGDLLTVTRMASPTPQDSQNVVWPSRPARWFHLWCLPALWLAAMGFLWADMVIRNLHGESSTSVVIAGIAGLWLTDLCGLAPGLALTLLSQGVGGVMVLALVGFFQDLLGVPRKIVVLYLSTAIVSFASFVVLMFGRIDAGGPLPNLLAYVHWFVMIFCIGLYALAGLSCVIYLVLFLGCKLLTHIRRT